MEAGQAQWPGDPPEQLNNQAPIRGLFLFLYASTSQAHFHHFIPQRSRVQSRIEHQASQPTDTTSSRTGLKRVLTRRNDGLVAWLV